MHTTIVNRSNFKISIYIHTVIINGVYCWLSLLTYICVSVSICVYTELRRILQNSVLKASNLNQILLYDDDEKLLDVIIPINLLEN